METRFAENDDRKRRNRRVVAGVLLIALGVAVAAVLSLTIFTDDWAVGGALVGGGALALLGVRVVAGKTWGGEIAVFMSLVAAVGSMVVAIVLDSS
jgi:uncharacterized membrane protein HdeD (DUF308 family)